MNTKCYILELCIRRQLHVVPALCKLWSLFTSVKLLLSMYYTTHNNIKFFKVLNCSTHEILIGFGCVLELLVRCQLAHNKIQKEWKVCFATTTQILYILNLSRHSIMRHEISRVEFYFRKCWSCYQFNLICMYLSYSVTTTSVRLVCWIGKHYKISVIILYSAIRCFLDSRCVFYSNDDSCTAWEKHTPYIVVKYINYQQLTNCNELAASNK